VLALIFGLAGNDLQWWLGAAISFALFLWIIFWFNPQNYWKNGLGIQEPRLVAISESGISIKSKSADFNLDWSQIARVDETREYFVVVTEKKTGGFVFPKRGIKSKEDEVNLRRHFEIQVPNPH
jgi:hypothetical protein